MRKLEEDIDYVGRDRRSMPLPFQSLNLLAFSFFFHAPLDFLSFLPLSSSGLSPPPFFEYTRAINFRQPLHA